MDATDATNDGWRRTAGYANATAAIRDAYTAEWDAGATWAATEAHLGSGDFRKPTANAATRDEYVGTYFRSAVADSGKQ